MGQCLCMFQTVKVIVILSILVLVKGNIISVVWFQWPFFHQAKSLLRFYFKEAPSYFAFFTKNFTLSTKYPWFTSSSKYCQSSEIYVQSVLPDLLSKTSGSWWREQFASLQARFLLVFPRDFLWLEKKGSKVRKIPWLEVIFEQQRARESDCKDSRKRSWWTAS